MNERIQELAAEAEEYADRQVDAGAEFHPAYTQHLAYLVARDCARIAMSQHTSSSPEEYGEMDSYGQGVDDAASTISGQIRMAYGVE